MELQQEQALNQQAYRRLKKKIDQTYCTGQYVAIVRGRVVADAPTFRELIAKLAPIEENCPEETPKELILLIKKMMSYASKDSHQSALQLLEDLYKLAKQYQVPLDEIEKRLAKFNETITLGLPMPPPSSSGF